MGNSDQEFCGCSGHLGRLVHGCTRSLLQYVVDVLNNLGSAAGDCGHTLPNPADGGTQRDPPVAEFSLGVQILHDLPEGIILHLRLSDIVELEDIDAVGSES